MDKIKPYKEQKEVQQVAGEPIAEYVSISLEQHSVPTYVREDISLGFEQFSRGEYLDSWDFVNSLHH